MIVQRETGGNLAETLENLDQVLRRRRQMRLKIKAMSSEARASAMIIGSLPFIMFTILMVVNSDYVMTLVTTHAGNILLTGAACSMMIGIAVIRKLIRFEI
jgi:tight adherence protein B